MAKNTEKKEPAKVSSYHDEKIRKKRKARDRQIKRVAREGQANWTSFGSLVSEWRQVVSKITTAIAMGAATASRVNDQSATHFFQQYAAEVGLANQKMEVTLKPYEEYVNEKRLVTDCEVIEYIQAMEVMTSSIDTTLADILDKYADANTLLQDLDLRASALSDEDKAIASEAIEEEVFEPGDTEESDVQEKFARGETPCIIPVDEAPFFEKPDGEEVTTMAEGTEDDLADETKEYDDSEVGDPVIGESGVGENVA